MYWEYGRNETSFDSYRHYQKKNKMTGINARNFECCFRRLKKQENKIEQQKKKKQSSQTVAGVVDSFEQSKLKRF